VATTAQGGLYETLKRLSTPLKIQNYLDTLAINFEVEGDTHWSPLRVYQEQKAHCIEAACFAAAALWQHGERPLLLDLRAAKGDYDHVVALYRSNGYWGAISKSNHATIRWRDPVYRTVRELALSYFHEWFPERTGVRTLRSYSRPVSLAPLGKGWITSTEDLWFLDQLLNRAPHYPIAPRRNVESARRADPVEVRAGSILEWDKRGKRIK
jgi:hypothetical protein